MSDLMATSDPDLDNADQIEDVTPEDPTGEGGNQQPETPPQAFVTREEFAAFQAMMQEQARRMAQSTTDKVSHRIKNELAALNGALAFQKQQGIQFTPQQERDMQQAIIQNAYATEAATSQPDQPENQGEPFNPIAENIANIMRSEGVAIDETDPEFAEFVEPVLQGPPNPAGVYRAVFNAIDKKKERQANRKTSARARLPVGTGTGQQPAGEVDISKITDSKELYKLGAKATGGGRR